MTLTAIEGRSTERQSSASQGFSPQRAGDKPEAARSGGETNVDHEPEGKEESTMAPESVESLAVLAKWNISTDIHKPEAQEETEPIRSLEAERDPT
eukprot:CAMPEP_0117060872 /NCGR_PEP_ID=MMETSP0472-20121206/42342_1 /TAXON_ID=693140 ORGANISM="Tiarina fusus, Strain LIS" /NCGR_SAMPLE_ID=MMETSP0472 /ASSEMBLY_ACC=CAM_ASM_000603 /LENGTH=95 /DNA_ID=CAMNT_0004779255 /DNA_START=132 /DNA_END=416 /DNA_ORIENTATION=+